MAAIDDALTEARARHPHWGIWVSNPAGIGLLAGAVSGLLRAYIPAGP